MYVCIGIYICMICMPAYICMYIHVQYTVPTLSTAGGNKTRYNRIIGAALEASMDFKTAYTAVSGKQNADNNSKGSLTTTPTVIVLDEPGKRRGRAQRSCVKLFGSGTSSGGRGSVGTSSPDDIQSPRQILSKARKGRANNKEYGAENDTHSNKKRKVCTAGGAGTISIPFPPPSSSPPPPPPPPHVVHHRPPPVPPPAPPSEATLLEQGAASGQMHVYSSLEVRERIARLKRMELENAVLERQSQEEAM